MIPKIFVISLAREKERRKLIKDNLSSHGLDATIFDAIDARNYSAVEITRKIDDSRRGWTNYLRPGAVCCALSHLGVYQEFLKGSDDYCLVLEDDAQFIATRKELAELMQSATDSSFPDIVLLNSYANEKVRVIDSGFRVSRKHKMYGCINQYPSSGLAYFINRNAAKKIVHYNHPVKATADQWNEFAELGFRVGVVKPDMFEPSFFESTIDYISSKDLWKKRIVPSWLRSFRRKASYSNRVGNIIFVEKHTD